MCVMWQLWLQWFLLLGVSQSKDNEPKVFVLYAGVDNVDVFHSNFRHLQGNNGNGYESNCLVVSFDILARSVKETVGNSCLMTEFYRGELIDSLKLLTPVLLLKAGYTHVLVIDTRTKLSNYNVKHAVDVMRRNNLSVALPHRQVTGQSTNHSSLKNLGSTTEILEMHAPIFTLVTWQCFWDMINPGLNPSGTGVDIYFYHYCRQKIQGLETQSHDRGQNQTQALKIGRLNNLRIGVLPPLAKDYQKQKTNPQVQLREWIEHLRNERSGLIKKGNKNATSTELK
jgi:hypothetical protein